MRLRKKALARAAAAIMVTSIVASASLPALAEGALQEDSAPSAAVEEIVLPAATADTAPSTDAATAAPEEPVPVAATEETTPTVPEAAAAPSTDANTAAQAENSTPDESSPTDATVPETPLTQEVVVGAGETKVMTGNFRVENWSGAFNAKDGGEITVNGNISTTTFGTSAENNGKLTLNGNITRPVDSVSGARPAIASKGGQITINGNIIDNGRSTSGAEAQDRGTKVVVTGNVTTCAWIQPSIGAVWANNGGTVEVGGNVTNTSHRSWRPKDPSTGASALAGGTVSIGGNVKANKIGAVAIDGTITIKGNVEAPETAVYIGGEKSTVLVGGNVSSPGKEVVIDAAFITNKDAAGNKTVNEVAIGGKIKNGSSSVDGAYLAVATNKDGSLQEENLPEFVVGEIEDVNKFGVTDNNGKALSETDQQKVRDNIKYIVRYADKTEDGQAAITVTKNDGSAFEKDSSGTYEVAKKGEEIKVKVQTIPGWVAQILPGKDNTVRENGDGTYTVTVAEGGGIDIRAVLKQIVTPPVKPPVTPPVTPVTPTGDEGENAVEAWLYVVGKDGSRIPYTQELRDGRMVFTTTAEDAALTGNLLALEELEVPTVQFVTPHKTSTFTVSTVCSAGGENDVFVLAHDKASSTLFAGNAVHNEYLS